MRFVSPRDRPYAMPRPEASAEMRAAALRLAREELAKPIPASSGQSDGAPWKAARGWASRILDVLGEEALVQIADSLPVIVREGALSESDTVKE